MTYYGMMAIAQWRTSGQQTLAENRCRCANFFQFLSLTGKSQPPKHSFHRTYIPKEVSHIHNGDGAQIAHSVFGVFASLCLVLLQGVP